MVFPEIPQNIADKVKRLFRSDKRKKIALELLFFDHWPEKKERQEIATRYDLEQTGIDKILYVLRDNDFFTKKQGSIPLYRAMMREEGINIDVDDSVDKEDAGLEEETLDRINIESSHDKVDSQRDDEDLSTNRINAIEVKIYDFEQRLDGFMAEMRTTVNKLSSSPPTENNPSQPTAENNPISETQVVETPNPISPFTNMSGEEVYEMMINQPREFREIMGINTPRQGEVQAVPVTVRKIIVDVTTYTLTCYEKAVNDGAFDGTFSDFMNQCVYKYFEDRGLALGWHQIQAMRRN